MHNLKKYSVIAFGNMLTAIGLSLFYLPNKIVNGGVSGISTILYHTMHIPVGISYAALNLLLFALCLIIMGKELVINSLFGAAMLSIFVEIFSHFGAVTHNEFLAVIFGGLLYGTGLALAFMSGASTGGTDILGRIVQYKFPHMSIGNLLLIIDGCIILVSFLIFKNAELAMYGIMALAISTYSVDFLMRKMNLSKIAFVISPEGAHIAEMLINTSPRGVTILEGTGAYTKTKQYMLVCAIKTKEITAFQKSVLEIDEHAFIIFSESQQIVGNGFYIYR